MPSDRTVSEQPRLASAGAAPPSLIASSFEQHNTPALLDHIRAGVKSGDASRLARSAHTLKGSLIQFCAVAAVNAARLLENLALAGTLAETPAALDTLEKELARFDQQLQQWLKEL